MGGEALNRADRLVEQGAWREAYASLAELGDTDLTPGDLERLATAAYMLGRDEEQLRALERAFHRHLDAADTAGAARCGFWLGVHHVLRGEPARGTGWFGRLRRLHAGRDSVEAGYVLIARGLEQRLAGDLEPACADAAAAAEIAVRFGDPDLLALALMDQGGYMVRLGRAAEGLAKLDEAMLAATAGELSPVVTGLVYCGVIESCQAARELRRASEWTEALAAWCERQPDLVPFTGTCLVHRSELLCLHGDWTAALQEARLARRRFERRSNAQGAGEATYLEGDVLRLRGEFAAAEDAYRDASRRGHNPQPGLSLLLLARGRGEAAMSAISQAMAGAAGWVERSRLLPALVEVMLSAGANDRATAGCGELEALAERHGGAMLHAQAAYARGACALAAADADAGLSALRRAARHWRELDAPHELARTRALLARACRALGDAESAALEQEAARAVFERLGASPDLARLAAPDARVPSTVPGGLTGRELQVLRLLASGRSNKQVAGELVVSKRTVDRHVSNIYAKLRVSTRAAATAYAYQHKLV